MPRKRVGYAEWNLILVVSNVCIILGFSNIMQTYSLGRWRCMMKSIKRAGLYSLGLVSLLATQWLHAEEVVAIPEQGKALIQSFATDLKAELQEAIKAGGLKNGIAVCSEKAPAIAQKYSNNQWQIKRTSLKVRNPANTPTEFERGMLLQFELKKSEGLPINKLSYYGVEKSESGEMHRLMKAIPTQALCLGCHGDNLSDDVKSELKLRYPEDQAVGFKEGDIRGAFSLIYSESF